MGKGRKRKTPVTKPPGFNGDHGTGAPAAKAGTVLEKMEGPNNVARRRRVNVIETLTLSMRQEQAARAIQDAYCRNEALSSGSPIKERVQSSPKPDATIARQVDARSRLIFVMEAVPRGDHRKVVEHICWENKPGKYSGVKNWRSLFADAMDRVADRLRF